MRTGATFALALLACAGTAHAADAEADSVTSLPKFDGDLKGIYSGCVWTGRCEFWGPCSFSGRRRCHACAASHTPHMLPHSYLTVDPKAGRDLFYMLAEHEGNTTDRTPLLMWTQG